MYQELIQTFAVQTPFTDPATNLLLHLFPFFFHPGLIFVPAQFNHLMEKEVELQVGGTAPFRADLLGYLVCVTAPGKRLPAPCPLGPLQPACPQKYRAAPAGEEKLIPSLDFTPPQLQYLKYLALAQR